MQSQLFLGWFAVVFLSLFDFGVAFIWHNGSSDQRMVLSNMNSSLAVFQLQEALLNVTAVDLPFLEDGIETGLRKFKDRFVELQKRAEELSRNKELSGASRIQLVCLKYHIDTALDQYQFRQFAVYNPFGFMSFVLRWFHWVMVPETSNEAKIFFIKIRRMPVLIDEMIQLMKDAVTAGVKMQNTSSALPTECGKSKDQRILNAEKDFRFWFESLNSSDPDHRRLINTGNELIKEILTPNYNKLMTYICNEYSAVHTSSSISLSSLPGGSDYYASLVRKHTTTNLTPEEIHAIGWEEIKRISLEMESIKKAEGFTATLREFSTLNNNYTYIHDEGDFEETVNALVLTLNERSNRVLKIPAQEPVHVHYIKHALANLASYSHLEHQVMLNIIEFNKISKQTLVPVLLHEGVPGHHTMLTAYPGVGQPALINEVWPFLRHVFTAYIEGWGLYAESLGHEMGMYTNNLEIFGRLELDMLRAVRLVIDTGIHRYRWTQSEAESFILKHTTFTSRQASVEVSRSLGQPGLLLGYKIGELRIKAIRRMVEDELDDQFDIREFHHQVLTVGKVPLDALQHHIVNWVQQLTEAHMDQVSNLAPKAASSVLRASSCVAFLVFLFIW